MQGTIESITIDYKDQKPIIALKLDNKSYLETIEELKQDKLDIEIKKHREKRSLNANNYAWKLINELAKKLNITAVEVYREHIKDLAICKQMTLNKNEFDTLKTAWNMLGIGWQVEKIDITSKDEIIANFYYGSSTYNTHQMARLIDNIVQDCKEQGIETKTPEELKRLVEE